MERQIHPEGLFPQEIKAIEQFSHVFGHMRMADTWKIYCGYQFKDLQDEGEFDAVLVTHCNIIILELKDWNNGTVTADKGRWYLTKGKDSVDMGRSAVQVTLGKQHLLLKKLGPYRERFSNAGRIPFIHYYVVFTGNAKINLPEQDMQHVLTLDQFLKLADKDFFNKTFKPHPLACRLYNDRWIFDTLFSEENVKPKSIVVNGYKKEQIQLRHPDSLFTESLATSLVTKDKALLRQWDFSKFPGLIMHDFQQRQKFIRHEQHVLTSIKKRDQDLYNHCLRPLLVNNEDATVESMELFELPTGFMRLNEFLGVYNDSLLDEEKRVNLIKVLCNKVVALHNIDISHGDIGEHSLWLSPSTEVVLSNLTCAELGKHKQNPQLEQIVPVFKLPKDRFSYTQQFQKDILALCIVLWHVFRRKRLSSHSLQTLANSKAEHWLEKIIYRGLAGEFHSVQALNDAIIAAQPVKQNSFKVDSSGLSKYVQAKNIYRFYPPEMRQSIFENTYCHVYVSGNYLVKCWEDVCLDKLNQATTLQLLAFFRELEDLESLNVPYLPKIVEFGIATGGNTLYLVCEMPTGNPCLSRQYSDNQLAETVKNLTESISHFHQLHYHMGNIQTQTLYVSDKLDICFLDFIQFGDSPKEHVVYPHEIANPTYQQIDNYAAVEVIGALCGSKSENPAYPLTSFISQLVEAEVNASKDQYLSLERILDGLLYQQGQQTKSLSVTIKDLRGTFEEMEILSDNGSMYIQFEWSAAREDSIEVSFHGIGGSFRAFYDRNFNSFDAAKVPFKALTPHPKVKTSAQLILNLSLKISSRSTYDLSQLTQELKSNELFRGALLEFINTPREKKGVLTEGLVSSDEILDHRDISTHQLWQAILDTETESNPAVLVDGEPHKATIKGKEYHIIPFVEDFEVLTQFKKDDLVQAITVRDGVETVIGDVSVKHSTSSILALTSLKNQRELRVDAYLYLLTKQSKSSFTKRRNALSRLIKREGVIPSLIDCFEPKSEEPAVIYPLYASDQDFARYDRQENDKLITLNSQQRIAFNTILANGPVSLLQGPPGTGKTEFIAALIHFLFERANVNNILLVSQSHEAVNNAAERIRKHCQRLDTPLEVVRFSNSEGSVSLNLKDVYSESLITARKELFKAEFKHRIMQLSTTMGLDPEYVEQGISIQLNIIDFLNNAHARSILPEQNELHLKNNLYLRIVQNIQDRAVEVFNITPEENTTKERIIAKVWTALNSLFNVTPHEQEKLQAVIDMAKDYIETIDTANHQYDSFLARTRQLVCGTCVGIGHHNIAIANNKYDWVIVDEAARSTASELAIAMQSGKRVLLVGDHKQLPPLYSEPHKLAIAQRLGVSTSPDHIDEILVSDFERMFESEYGKSISAKLLTQYRMQLPIGQLVSHCFYNNELLTGERAVSDCYERSGIHVLQHTVTWLNTSGVPNAFQYEDKGASLYNPGEAMAILDVLDEIAKNAELLKALGKITKANEASIGVICMYGEQKRYLRTKFRARDDWPDSFKRMVKIDTVDSYQGKENRIIIMSVTRNDKTGKVGFLKKINRINVALSRAMDRLIIVGSTAMWNGKNAQYPLGKVLSYIEEQEKVLKKEEPTKAHFYTVMDAPHPNAKRRIAK